MKKSPLSLSRKKKRIEQNMIISIEERKLEAKANNLEDAEGTPYVISGDYGGMYR